MWVHYPEQRNECLLQVYHPPYLPFLLLTPRSLLLILNSRSFERNRSPIGQSYREIPARVKKAQVTGSPLGSS